MSALERRPPLRDAICELIAAGNKNTDITRVVTPIAAKIIPRAFSRARKIEPIATIAAITSIKTSNPTPLLRLARAARLDEAALRPGKKEVAIEIQGIKMLIKKTKPPAGPMRLRGDSKISFRSALNSEKSVIEVPWIVETTLSMRGTETDENVSEPPKGTLPVIPPAFVST